MTVAAGGGQSPAWSADGTNRTWYFDYRFISNDHIRLIVRNSAGVETVVTSGFLIQPAMNNEGGAVTYPLDPEPALPAGYTVTVVREVPYTQPTRIGNQGIFHPQTHEDTFDLLAMQIQQVAAKNGGGGNGGGGAKTLDDLLDVNVSGAVNGYVLKLDNGIWRARPDETGSGGSTYLDALTDVQLTPALAGQILTFDGVMWTNMDLPAGEGVADLAVTQPKLSVPMKRPATSVGDYADFQFVREANYSGKVNGNNSNVIIRTEVEATAGTFEWALLGIMNNRAPISQASENVAIYGQGNKYSSGNTWAACFEAKDHTGLANPTGGLVGIEIDVCGNGTDNNGYQNAGNRVALDIIGWRTNPAGAQAHIGHAIRICPQAFDPANAYFRRGISFYGSYGMGLDFTKVTAIDYALLLGNAHKVAWGDTGARSIRVESGLFTYRANAADVMQVNDSGDMTLLGRLTAKDISLTQGLSSGGAITAVSISTTQGASFGGTIIANGISLVAGSAPTVGQVKAVTISASQAIDAGTTIAANGDIATVTGRLRANNGRFNLDGTFDFKATGGASAALGNTKPGTNQVQAAAWIKVVIDGATMWVPAFAN